MGYYFRYKTGIDLFSAKIVEGSVIETQSWQIMLFRMSYVRYAKEKVKTKPARPVFTRFRGEIKKSDRRGAEQAVPVRLAPTEAERRPNPSATILQTRIKNGGAGIPYCIS